MYHRIADDPFDPWGTIVTPGRFAEQVAWLSERRTVLPLPKLAELHAKGQLPPDATAITFDDGYSCNAEIAAPLLETGGLPATMFLPVEWIERGSPYWWDEIRQIVFECGRGALKIGDSEIELGEKEAGDRKWQYGAPPRTARQLAFHQVWQELILRTPDEIERLMKELRSQFDRRPNDFPMPRPMSGEQVRSTASTNIEFGSHALRHPALTSLPAAEQAYEIGESVARCEALTGRRPTSFAYPFGIFDEGSEQLVIEAGFSCACSVEAAPVKPDSRTYALPRIQVGDWPAAKLKRALALA